MKKIVSLLLAVLMICSTFVTAFALDSKITASPVEIYAGGDVTISVSFDENYSNLASIEARVYFNTDLFDYKTGNTTKTGANIAKNTKKDNTGTYLQVSLISVTGDIEITKDEVVAELVFTAKENVTAKTEAKFLTKISKGGGTLTTDLPEGVLKEISVTILPVLCDHSETETAYTSKNNGTHTKTVTCKKCGTGISSEVEDCTKGTDGKCEYCGYVFPADDEYTITVNVAPKTVDVTFYSDEDGTTKLDSNKVVDKKVSGNYHVYEITVPKGTYSYRATDSEDGQSLGGMTFEAPISTEVDASGNPISSEQKMTLVRVNYYTTDENVKKIGDYSIEIMPGGMKNVVTGRQYINVNNKVVTPALLFAHGNALLYNWKVSLSEELAKNYGVSAVYNVAFPENLDAAQNKTFTLSELLDYSVTAPKSATVRFFNQNKYFDVEELPVNSKTENTNETVTYILRAVGGNLMYRVSMEGKVTKAGYFDASTNQNIIVTFAADENPKSTVNKMESSEMEKRIESSTLVNVNAKNELSLGVGETFRLRSYRAAWQIINSDTGNIMIEPDFNYKIISGSEHIEMTPANNRCTGNAGTGEQTNWMDIKGVSKGTAILEVSYDAIEIGGNTEYTGTYGATDPKRTALVVINVGGEEGKLSMTAKDTDHEWDAEFDTVYTFENTATLNFTATLDDGETTVQLSTDKGKSWKNVAKNSDGTFTASGLVEGNNILKFTANGKTAYQVVRAAKLTYTVTNLTTENASDIYVGNTASIVFSGLYQPMPKISGIYNPGYGSPAGNQIVYNIPDNAEQSGRSEHYSFVSTRIRQASTEL